MGRFCILCESETKMKLLDMKSYIKKILTSNAFFLLCYAIIFSMLYRALGVFCKINEKMIIFESFGGEKYSGSPRCIYEYLVKDERFSDFNFVWALNDCSNLEFHDKPRTLSVKIDSFSFFYYLLKSKYWIANVSMTRGLFVKRKKNIYINTWHGFPIKKIGYDINRPSCSYALRQMINIISVDYFLSRGAFETELLSRAFRVNKNKNKFLNIGSPSTDLIYKSQTRIDMFKKLDAKNKKIILYAPTFRQKKTSITAYSSLNFERLTDTLIEKDYIILIKMHPLVQNKIEIPSDSIFIDVSFCEDINELFGVSHMLITDYSSLCFDYLIAEKPIIFYIPDWDLYCKERGGMYLSKNELPGIVCENEDSLIDAILNEYTLTIKEISFYKNKYNEYCDGKSTKRFADWMVDNFCN